MGGWAVIQADTTGQLHTHFTVSSYTDNGAGDHTLTWAIPFASASSYAVFGTANTNLVGCFTAIDPSANSLTSLTVNTSNIKEDSSPTTVIAVGRR